LQKTLVAASLLAQLHCTRAFPRVKCLRRDRQARANKRLKHIFHVPDLGNCIIHASSASLRQSQSVSQWVWVCIWLHFFRNWRGSCLFFIGGGFVYSWEAARGRVHERTAIRAAKLRLGKTLRVCASLMFDKARRILRVCRASGWVRIYYICLRWIKRQPAMPNHLNKYQHWQNNRLVNKA
jgi:hypothetical protein